MNTLNQTCAVFGAVLLTAAMPVRGETARDFAMRYAGEARAASPSFAPSATRGAEFFRSRHGQDWSCATCHGETPIATGKHATTNKPIEPLAPASNAQRFTDAAKVEKWFKRNCKDVLSRECTAAEKSDVIAFLLTTSK